MPARPNIVRALHVPASTSKPPLPAFAPHAQTQNPSANYHLKPSPRASFSRLRAEFIPPVSPQLPPRRQPTFNPGGFGLQVHPGKGKERAVEEVERRDAEIGRDERRLENRENEEEEEACYVVRSSRTLSSSFKLMNKSIAAPRDPPPSLVEPSATPLLTPAFTAVPDSLRNVGQAERLEHQRDTHPYRPLRVLPCRLGRKRRGSHHLLQARLVGRLCRPREIYRYRQVLRNLHQRPRRMFRFDWPFFPLPTR